MHVQCKHTSVTHVLTREVWNRNTPKTVISLTIAIRGEISAFPMQPITYSDTIQLENYFSQLAFSYWHLGEHTFWNKQFSCHKKLFLCVVWKHTLHNLAKINTDTGNCENCIRHAAYANNFLHISDWNENAFNITALSKHSLFQFTGYFLFTICLIAETTSLKKSILICGSDIYKLFIIIIIVIIIVVVVIASVSHGQVSSL